MISFTVYGKPQSRGSKSPMTIRTADGYLVYRKDKFGEMILDKNRRPIPVIVMPDSAKGSKPWMAAVSAAAGEAMAGHDLIVDLVILSVSFHFRRPKSDYGTGRNAGKLKKSAPAHHAKQPDLSKLVRGVEDALTGIVYRDDRQICRYGEVEKRWTDAQERAVITVSEMGVPAVKEAGQADEIERLQKIISADLDGAVDETHRLTKERDEIAQQMAKLTGRSMWNHVIEARKAIAKAKP